jgi:hypothetical protein
LFLVSFVLVCFIFFFLLKVPEWKAWFSSRLGKIIFFESNNSRLKIKRNPANLGEVFLGEFFFFSNPSKKCFFFLCFLLFEEANRSLVVWQDRCQEAQTKLVNLKSEDQSQFQKQNTEYQELQTTHGKLVNQHQNLIQLHNQLKQQFVQLKMNFANIQQKSNQNVEVYKLQAQVQGLEREKGELTTMVDMLLKQIE